MYDWMMFHASPEQSKNKYVKTRRYFLCFWMAIVVHDYELVTFAKRRYKNDQEVVTNKRFDFWLLEDSCRFEAALFYLLMSGNRGPRLSSKHSAYSYTYSFHAFFIFCLLEFSVSNIKLR